MTDQNDQFDYPDRVIQMALGYNHLVVVTVKQCFIHKLSSWNTPVTFDLKDGTISMLLLTERLEISLKLSLLNVLLELRKIEDNFCYRCICIVERAGLSIYSFMGRLLASPRWTGMRPDSLGRASVSLGPDTLAVIDQTDRKGTEINNLIA